MWVPVHLSDHYYDPDKEYCGLYLVSKIELPSFGPTSELIKIFNRRNISLLTINSHRKGDLIYDFIIIDLTGKKRLKEEIRKEILDKFGDRLRLFECIETGIPGFVFNKNGFPLVFNFNDEYTPVAAIGIHAWKTLFEGLIERFGAGGSVIIWFMGMDMGENSARRVMRLKGSFSCPDRIKISLSRLQSLGWGKFEIAECDESGKRVVIRVRDNFEELATLDMEDYESNFLRGFLVGLISVLFGKACRGTESKCIKKGDKYCEFVIR